MAFTHGKKTYFALGTAAAPGTPTDVSQYFDSVDMPENIETADTTTFGDDVRTFIIGLSDSSFSASGKWDPAIDEHLAGLKYLDNVAWEYGPEGNGSGAVIYSGQGVMTSYSRSSPVGDVTTLSIDFQISGMPSRATNA